MTKTSETLGRRIARLRLARTAAQGAFGSKKSERFAGGANGRMTLTTRISRQAA